MLFDRSTGYADHGVVCEFTTRYAMNEFDVGHGPSNFDDALLSCDDSGLDIATFASEVNPDQNEVCKERTMKKTTINILGRVAPIHEINLESD